MWMWSGGGAAPEQWNSGAAREAEAGRRHRWRDKQLEQEGDAYDRCSEVCALSL